MFYLVLRILILAVCLAGSISAARYAPASKISAIEAARGALETVAIFGIGFGAVGYQSLVRALKRKTKKKWQVPFWTSSFDEAPINWIMSGVLWSGASALATFVYAAFGEGQPSFGFIFMGMAIGLSCGITLFKKKWASQLSAPPPARPAGDHP